MKENNFNILFIFSCLFLIVLNIFVVHWKREVITVFPLLVFNFLVVYFLKKIKIDDSNTVIVSTFLNVVIVFVISLVFVFYGIVSHRNTFKIAFGIGIFYFSIFLIYLSEKVKNK